MTVETSAKDTERDIVLQSKGEDACLTCGARARSVVRAGRRFARGTNGQQKIGEVGDASVTAESGTRGGNNQIGGKHERSKRASGKMSGRAGRRLGEEFGRGRHEHGGMKTQGRWLTTFLVDAGTAGMAQTRWWGREGEVCRAAGMAGHTDVGQRDPAS